MQFSLFNAQRVAVTVDTGPSVNARNAKRRLDALRGQLATAQADLEDVNYNLSIVTMHQWASREGKIDANWWDAASPWCPIRPRQHTHGRPPTDERRNRSAGLEVAYRNSDLWWRLWHRFRLAYYVLRSETARWLGMRCFPLTVFLRSIAVAHICLAITKPCGVFQEQFL